MIHHRAFAAQVGPGQKCVLLALWDFSGWRPGGDPRPFVWPSRDTLAAKLSLSRSSVDRSLRLLEADGWIVAETDGEREGWRLVPEPERSAPQLDLFAADPVDNLGMAEPESSNVAPSPRNVAPKSTQPCASLPFEQHERHERAADDDDAARLWSTYEADRARMLPSSPLPRTGAPPLAMRALIAELGLPRVEAYARRSLELAADAVARDRQCAATLVLARADGREWHPKRVEAVERFPDPPREAPPPRPPPPPAPVVDGEPVAIWEREAWREGGEEAVRRSRGTDADRLAGVAQISDWLAKRKVGSHV